MGKKHERKGRSLRDMAYEVTPAQRLMRKEMEAGVHRAGSVVDSVVGVSRSSAEVEALALKVIGESEVSLRLGLQEWRAVQDLVEAGIRAGMEVKQ